MPLGWATDLAILELTGSTVDYREDYVVVRTPGNPDYHWGHCLLVTDKASVNDADRWAGIFHEEFPEATWLAVGLPTMPHDVDAWARHGMDLEQLDVLATASIPRSAALADGYTVRHLTGEDWDTMAAREIADNTAPVSIALTRQLIWRMAGASHPMEAHMADSRGIQARGAMADAKEGVTSFLEKRLPRYPDKVSTDLPNIWEHWSAPKFR